MWSPIVPGMTNRRDGVVLTMDDHCAMSTLPYPLSVSEQCDAIVRAIEAARFTCAGEKELQLALAQCFANAGIDATREVRLDTHSTIDFLAGRVGIEVKIAGSPIAVMRQLQRYAHSEQIDGLVLATRRFGIAEFPATIAGKPLVIAHVRSVL